jgi:anti-sigma-K factor RskA
MLLAAEYALGTLDLADKRRAEAMAAQDPRFAAEITYWQDRLSPLTSLVVPVEPPASLWPRLALATGLGGLAAAPQPRRSSRVWQGATAVSLAIAASLALFAFLPRPPSAVPEQARFAAALAPLNSPAQFLAEARPDGSLTVTNLAVAPAPAGRAYELWGLPQGAAAPVSLGLLSTGQRTITPPVRPSAREQLLVSDEPAGGSPTGAPTGSVLWGGTLVPVSPAGAPGR